MRAKAGVGQFWIARSHGRRGLGLGPILYDFTKFQDFASTLDIVPGRVKRHVSESSAQQTKPNGTNENSGILGSMYAAESPTRRNTGRGLPIDC